MFMKLEDGRVYCLPDGYEVEDRSLDPIRYVLNPTFAPEKVRVLLSPWSVLIPALGDHSYRSSTEAHLGSKTMLRRYVSCYMLYNHCSVCLLLSGNP